MQEPKGKEINNRIREDPIITASNVAFCALVLGIAVIVGYGGYRIFNN